MHAILEKLQLLNVTMVYLLPTHHRHAIFPTNASRQGRIHSRFKLKKDKLMQKVKDKTSQARGNRGNKNLELCEERNGVKFAKNLT